MTEDLLETRDRITPTLREHGVVRAAVFGSRARGEADASSDLDLLVEFENNRTLLDLVGLRQDLSHLLGAEADVVTYGSLHPQLRERILREQIRLL